MSAISNAFNVQVISNTLPAWAASLQPGTFKEVPAVNNAVDVNPAIYGGPGRTAGVENQFSFWVRRVWAPNYGTHGAIVHYGSGHTQMHQGCVIFDLGQLRWFFSNAPTQRHTPQDPQDADGRFVSDRSFYAPHTYLHSEYFPPAWGGDSPNGSLILSGFTTPHILDLSQPTGGERLLATTRYEPQGTSGMAGYGACDIDYGRQGWWLSSSLGKQAFLHRSGVWTYYENPKSPYDWHPVNYYAAEDILIYLEPILDVLPARPSTTHWAGWRLWGWRPGTPSRILLTQAGTPPKLNTPLYGGFNWSTILGCFIWYWADCQVANDSGYLDRPIVRNDPKLVNKLTPPPLGQALTGRWTWSSETLTSADGFAPHTAGYSNGTFRALIEVPQYRCFIHCGGWSVKPQAFRLTGM